MCTEVSLEVLNTLLNVEYIAKSKCLSVAMAGHESQKGVLRDSEVPGKGWA